MSRSRPSFRAERSCRFAASRSFTLRKGNCECHPRSVLRRRSLRLGSATSRCRLQGREKCFRYAPHTPRAAELCSWLGTETELKFCRMIGEFMKKTVTSRALQGFLLLFGICGVSHALYARVHGSDINKVP